MFDIFLDFFKKLFKSRLFPITLIYLALFVIIVNRLFIIQIVQGPIHASESNTKYIKTREISSTRGNIYDRNGKLLATNALSYAITIDDNDRIESNKQRNRIIHDLVNIIEKNGDTLDTEFYIRQNSKGKLEFTVKDTENDKALTRFKKNAYAYTLDKKTKELTEEQKNATAQDVYDFLKNGTKTTPMFSIEGYSVKDTLKIMAVRFAIFCNYPKYQQVTVASNVTDGTVAAVKESSADLIGVDVQKQTKRVYNDSLYYSHLLGYTGKINAQELEKYNKANGKDYYDSSDIIGKTGLEMKYEKYLAGKKGSEMVAINHSTNKVIKVVDRKDPTAGNDLYLTIDGDLQKAAYHILEKEITGILISKIRSGINDYGSKGKSASKITIPIYEVYNALLNNNVIDITHFKTDDASSLEKQTYRKFHSHMRTIFNKLDDYLSINSKVTNDKAGDMEDYLDYFYQILSNQKVLLKNSIPKNDSTYKSYQDGDISLSAFLKYAIANNWIDLSKLKLGEKYYNSDEIYRKLINYTKDNLLKNDSVFNKMIYRDLIFSYKLSGTEICLLLFDQGVLKYNQDEINGLKSGSISSYSFMINKLKSLDITPGMLALEPCSGSIVITDVKTGEVRALVSYPGYDNNKLANKMDVSYYNKLHADKAYPWMNRPVSQLMAPGSTFKMVTSFAALESGITTPSTKIFAKNQFTNIKPSPKEHIYPSSYGWVNLSDSLRVSCNYYFYEMGWLLSKDSTGSFNEKLGLKKLNKYASMFGLNKTSGIELYEAKPHLSDKDSVRSAIGQGSNNFTPVQLSKYVTTLANGGTCYNLTLLDKIIDEDGKILLKSKHKVTSDLTKFPASSWDAVHQGMYEVANTAGGSAYSIFKDFDVTVAGKTGTSQISVNHPNNALFVSYAPYDKPEISVTAVIPNGYTSVNAAEMTREVYKYYFKLVSADKLLNSKVKLPQGSVGSID